MAQAVSGLSAEKSPFGTALTHARCLQYALDRPGVLVAAPGVQTLAHFDQLLHFLTATDAEKDYSVIGSFKTDAVTGTCVYCNHCQPCPAGIDIGLVNKYYDLALAGDAIAANHYARLSVKADACLHCGHCERRCRSVRSRWSACARSTSICAARLKYSPISAKGNAGSFVLRSLSSAE